jgi:hypothetical protein
VHTSALLEAGSPRNVSLDGDGSGGESAGADAEQGCSALVVEEARRDDGCGSNDGSGWAAKVCKMGMLALMQELEAAMGNASALQWQPRREVAVIS